MHIWFFQRMFGTLNTIHFDQWAKKKLFEWKLNISNLISLLSGPFEESIISSSVSDCECLICCTDRAPCAILLDKLCYCNQYCRTASDTKCCPNETICDIETINPSLIISTREDSKWMGYQSHSLFKLLLLWKVTKQLSIYLSISSETVSIP